MGKSGTVSRYEYLRLRRSVMVCEVPHQDPFHWKYADHCSVVRECRPRVLAVAGVSGRPGIFLQQGNGPHIGGKGLYSAEEEEKKSKKG